MSKSNTSKGLPWWVELLFVQIGLPDHLLRSFLINKKKAKHFYSKNKGSFTILVVSLCGILYLYPLVKQARTHNQCIDDSKNIVKQMYDQNDMLSKSEIRAVATNFCNGGGI